MNAQNQMTANYFSSRVDKKLTQKLTTPYSVVNAYYLWYLRNEHPPKTIIFQISFLICGFSTNNANFIFIHVQWDV